MVYGPPQVVMLTSNIDENLVQIPCVTKFASRLSESFCIAGRKFKAPLPYGFVADVYIPGGKKIFHLSEVQRESIVEPNGTANHHFREAMAL